MSPATKLLDVKYPQPSGGKTLNGNGVPVRLLMPPEEDPIADEATPQEPLMFHDLWAGIERVGSQAGTLLVTMFFHLVEFVTVCATSPMWRTSSLALVQAASTGVALFFQAQAAIVEKLSALPWGDLWRTGKKISKLAVCVGMDCADFFIGRILGVGIVFDILCACMCAALWGKRGWVAILEVVDITEQIDGFLPTCTLIALRCWNDE